MPWEGGSIGSGRWLGLVSVLVAGLTGCVAHPTAAPAPPAPRADDVDEEPTAPSRSVFSWFADRGLDLVDVASVRVAAGPGLLVHARVTPWIAAGAGMLGRPESWTGGFEAKLYQLGWVLRGGGVWTERRAEVGLSKFYYCESEPNVLAGFLPEIVPENRGPWDIGAEAHLALIGAGAEVRLDELVDFVSGWFGFDPSEDDAAER